MLSDMSQVSIIFFYLTTKEGKFQKDFNGMGVGFTFENEWK